MKQAIIKMIDTATIEVKTPDEWCKIHGIEVIDPDGWRRDGLSWETYITEAEFHARVGPSTIKIRPPEAQNSQPAPGESETSRHDSSSSTEGQKS